MQVHCSNSYNAKYTRRAKGEGQQVFNSDLLFMFGVAAKTSVNIELYAV